LGIAPTSQHSPMSDMENMMMEVPKALLDADSMEGK